MALCVGYVFTAVEEDGSPLALGLVYSYYPETLYAKATYSDYSLSVENTNPVVLDAAGQAEIYLSSPTRLIIVSADGRTVGDVREVSGFTTTADSVTVQNLAVVNDLTVADDLTVNGDLTVSGNMVIDPGAEVVDFHNVDELRLLPAHTVGGTLITTGSISTETVTIVGATTVVAAIYFVGSMAAADAPINSLFRDVADDVIKLRDNAGDLKGLY